MPLGDDHGVEAVVGCRDADWAHGNSAVTNILLLSAVWVVGAVFANRNALALGKILNQQGVGNSSGVYMHHLWLSNKPSSSGLAQNLVGKKIALPG